MRKDEEQVLHCYRNLGFRTIVTICTKPDGDSKKVLPKVRKSTQVSVPDLVQKFFLGSFGGFWTVLAVFWRFAEFCCTLSGVRSLVRVKRLSFSKEIVDSR